jgi:hypothetical protein
MYIPLYNESIGLGGFKCKDCGRVTRTLSGIKSHLWRVHGKKAQLELFAAEPLSGGTYAIVLYYGGDNPNSPSSSPASEDSMP